MNTKVEDKIDIYQLEDPDDILQYYKKWSFDNSYEKDLEEWNYVAPKKCVDLLIKHHIDQDSLILDAGCGTGLVGTLLKKNNFNNIEGLDFSQDMLDLIPNNTYRQTFCCDLNKPLSFDDCLYDSVICVGTFTYGHVKPLAFDEINRIIKKDGLFCFSINEGVFSKYNFDKSIEKLIEEKKWDVLEINKSTYIEKKDVDAYYYLIKVN